MQLFGKPKAYLRQEAKDFINLYASLGERAENFLPNRILDNLTNFVRLCYEEPDDPVKQQAEMDKYILEFKEAIPGYVDVSLMLYPTEDSKAFLYNSKKLEFTNRVNYLIDTEAVDGLRKTQAQNILNLHDYSIGTPPVTKFNIDFRNSILLGDSVEEIRKFRDVIGITGDIEEAQWKYMLDVFEQMIVQSSHYTTKDERKHFLERTESTVNFKGLNGFIRTFVSGTADTAIKLLKGDVFHPEAVKVIDYTDQNVLFNQIKDDFTSIFVVKVKHKRKNIFNDEKWFPYLTRLVIVDDSAESRSTNTCLVFCFHNKIINTLNNAHTKKLGALANTQVNLRLIIDKVNTKNIEKFKSCAEQKILDYNEELKKLKIEQVGEVGNLDKDIVLFKFDEFARQIIKDKYTLTKFRDYLDLILDIKDPAKQVKRNRELIEEFERRIKKYYYSSKAEVLIATILEGGGRNQIRTYGQYLLQKKINHLDEKIKNKCLTVIDIIPNTFQRTLYNHFHKNFGLNLFLEKYKEYMTKVENEANNTGRFKNFLIDLGILEAYEEKTKDQQKIIKAFISDLANLNKTSISDDVQMIIRDLFYIENRRPYIIFNQESSWEYKDLFPVDRFDINPFDISVELTDDGRIAYERLQNKLSRIKATFQLFDDTGNLWDHFCENLTIVINDPANPTGYSDFNNVELINFLKFLNNSKITLFLDEAYNDSVKIDDPEEPKWRIISRYVMNNMATLSKISVVSSLSTTKNLGATGSRLGPIIATPAMKDVIDYAKKNNSPETGNTNSLYMLNNVLEIAHLAKKIKDVTEDKLPRNASRYKIKEQIENYIKAEIEKRDNYKLKNQQGAKVWRYSEFEGSPLHIFLLEELSSLDKLDVLELPDDFKYRGEPFFSYYKEQLVKTLNKHRVNKNFRSESNKRLKLVKKVAVNVIKELNVDYLAVIESDGSYLFNLLFNEFLSYQDLEKFMKRLASERGIAVIPYKTGAIRFSLGGFIVGTPESYGVFAKEFENSLKIVLKYWNIFISEKQLPENNEKRTEDILDEIFYSSSDKEFINDVLSDFDIIKDLTKESYSGIRINDIKTLYHAFPEDSGVNITSIGTSKNSVLEFYENIGECRTLSQFISSKAFSTVYENLLPQVYKNNPRLKYLNIHSVIAKYGKPAIQKFIDNKLEFLPNSHVLDNPGELIIMREILIDMERILFSDAKMKIMTFNASECGNQNIMSDIAKLEGANQILRKHIKELLLHFNLPFEKEAVESTCEELMFKAVVIFEEVIGKKNSELNLKNYIADFVNGFEDYKDVKNNANISQIQKRYTGYLKELLDNEILNSDINDSSKLLNLYLLFQDNSFYKLVAKKLDNVYTRINAISDLEVKLISEEILSKIVIDDFADIYQQLLITKDIKITQQQLHVSSRSIVLFLVDIMNRTKANEYYNRYTYSLVKLLEAEFQQQNSSINEMVQHGITLHKDFTMKNTALEKHNNGSLKWINDLMTKCGVIASEQPVQIHTRIATDAKKREFPFHRIDRDPSSETNNEQDNSPNAYIKRLHTRPSADFFNERMKKFIQNMDANDYRCKILNKGIIKELFVFQKAYLKYLTDNYRLLEYQDITLDDLQDFVPDIITFLGAPEKVISYPQIGYFDLAGPNGNIKTLISPLKKKNDYFGDVKKPRLTMMNEKIKELGGIPVHGSLFAVELEDGGIFVVSISGDSGVGKSEMLTAMMLKWLKKNLPGIRSMKTIAGDMFQIFPDKKGNLYAIGTEGGDFSRVTDFDPDFIKYYNSLFQSSADSNVEDLNSRSTISGLCDISMPFKIDIMLSASNFAQEEAGIIRYDNPENFILYRDSHGERREKATSSDNPNFQRTLIRYTGDKNVVDLIDAHGNILDNILDWEEDTVSGTHYLCSSYKMIDKVDIEETINKIFVDKIFTKNKIKFKIVKVDFDIIKNRFTSTCNKVLVSTEDDAETNEIINDYEFVLERDIFSEIFNSLASTPSGQPFIAENDQVEGRKNLVNILKGGSDGKGLGRNIQFGVLSTDIGRKGKEITGPQKAAQDMVKLIHEIRIMNPEINTNKQMIKNLVNEKYANVFPEGQNSPDIWRHNFALFQFDAMMKADFVRIDDMEKSIDLSNLKDFKPRNKNQEFCPLLVTPNINKELNGFTETFDQLMSLPNNPEFAEDFYETCKDLYIATGYPEETVRNNMVLQLLLLNRYISIDDITRSRITEKVNRETLAAARFAVERRLKESKTVETKGKAVNDTKSKAKPKSDTKKK